MSDIRKRRGPKGTTYQVRSPSKAAKSGYAYKTFNTRKEALAFVESGKARHAGTRAPAETKTVPEGVDEWLNICEKIGRDGREKVEPQTLVEYKRRGRVMKEYPWPKTLPDLEPADIVHFRNWLLENKSRDLARRTLSSFHSMLIEMKQQGNLNDDPAGGITIRSGGRYEDDDSEIQIPTDAEVRDILDAADSMGTKNDFMEKCWARYRPMIYLATFSGMRPSEYRGLPWSNLFEDHVQVRQRADKTGLIGPVKSKAGKRTIHLPRLVTDIVFQWKERCPKSKIDLVFPTESGAPQMLTNIYRRAWVPLLREVGLTQTERKNGREIDTPKYPPYALRHYYASKLIAKGKDLKYIQKAMGHSKIEITLNVYGHLLKDHEDAHKETAEELAAELLGSRCGKSVANNYKPLN